MPETRTRARRSSSDEDVDSQVLGSGDPALQEEARQAVIDEVGEDAYLADPDRFWTAQQGPKPDSGFAAVQGPQKFLKEQLPDPAVAKLAGIPAQQIPQGLVLDVEADPEAALSDPHGPEPGELVRLVKNDAVNQHLIARAEEAPTGRDVLTLTSHSMGEIRRAQEPTAEGVETESEAETEQTSGGSDDGSQTGD